MRRGKATFDPKIFLAKVGEGKIVSKYRKDQIVFSQGEVADAVFYIQQGQVKLTRQGSGGCNIGTRSFLWRRMSEWPSAAHRNNEDGR
jgi:CRP-like cAMP-binding protein